MTVLEAEGLHKSFGGVHAVRDVSFSLAAGELVALIGPNGAGKTTCFNMLNGQLRPEGGRVLLDGTDVTGRKPRQMWARGVARTFQITQVWASMSVVENVQTALLARHRLVFSFFARAARLHLDEARALLADVGMEDQAHRPCAVLAYGDLKRVELAVALAGAPKLLLMDEPTAGMAPAERLELMALTARLVRERGLTVLFTEHDMDVVFAHADRVLVLDRGRLIAEGPPDRVRGDEKVREVYLGSGAVFA